MPAPEKTYTLIVTGPADVLDNAVQAYARAYGWTASLTDASGNPIPPEQFAREPILKYLRDTAETQILREAAQSAVDAVRANLADKSPQIGLAVE